MDLWAGSGPAAFVTLGIPLFNFLLHSYTLLHRYARNVSLQLQTLMDFDRSVTLVNRGTYGRHVFLFRNRAIAFARSAVTSTTHMKTLLTSGVDSLCKQLHNDVLIFAFYGFHSIRRYIQCYSKRNEHPHPHISHHEISFL
jgi:hypothetical protein